MLVFSGKQSAGRRERTLVGWSFPQVGMFSRLNLALEWKKRRRLLELHLLLQRTEKLVLKSVF